MSSRSKLQDNPKSLNNNIDDIDIAFYTLRLFIVFIVLIDVVVPTIWAICNYKAFVEEYDGIGYLIIVYSISFYHIFSSNKSKIIAFAFKHLKKKIFLRKWVINISFYISSFFSLNNNTANKTLK